MRFACIMITTVVTTLIFAVGVGQSDGEVMGGERLGAGTAGSTEGTVVSRNWSGYVLTNTVRDIFGANVHFVVPKLNCPTSGAYSASIWAGLGGNTSGDLLVQTGVEADCDAGVASYFAWWEYVPGVTAQQYGGAVHAGDNITAGVQEWVNPGEPPTQEYYASDYGTGLARIKQGKPVWDAPPIVTHVKAGRRASLSAECIVERPQIDSAGDLAFLAHFAPISFTNVTGEFNSASACDAYLNMNAQGGDVGSPSAAGPQPDGATSTKILLENPLRQQLDSTTNPRSSGEFTTSWLRAK